MTRRASAANIEKQKELKENVAFITEHVTIAPGTHDMDARSSYPVNLLLAIKNGRTDQIPGIIDVIEKILPFVPKRERQILQKNLLWRNIPNREEFLRKVEQDCRFLFDDEKNPPLWKRLDTEPPIVNEPAEEKYDKRKQLVLTDSHKNDAEIIDRVMKEENTDPHRVAVVVLDRHTDLTSAGGKIDFTRRACAVSSMINKGVGQVDIVGMEYKSIEGLVDPSSRVDQTPISVQILTFAHQHGLHTSDVGEILAIYDRYLRAADTGSKDVILYTWMADPTFIEYVSNYRNEQIGKEHHIGLHARDKQGASIEHTARTILSNYRERGIGTFIFSIDLDVLDLWHEGITSTMYSPYATIGLLANLNLPYLKARLAAIRGISSEPMQQAEALTTILDVVRVLMGFHEEKIMVPDYHLMMSFMNPTQDTLLSNKRLPPPAETITGFEGLPLEKLLEFIMVMKKLAPEYGISFGIQRKNEAAFLGTITEAGFDKPDLRGNATNAIGNISRALVA